MSKDSPDVVVIERAKRFDIAKVLMAFQRLIDQFAAEFGDAAVVIPHPRGVPTRLRWDLEGKRKTLAFWMQAKVAADASDDRTCHPAGPVTAQAHLLGSWAYSPVETGTELVARLMENEPVVHVFGREMSEPEDEPLFAFPTPEDNARVERIVTAARDLDLRFSMSPQLADPAGGAKASHGIITFPHSAYGDGFGRVRTRIRPAVGRVKGNRALN